MTGKIIEVIYRSVFSYIILLALGKIIGRKMISSITFYDFMIGVTIGSFVVRIALGSEQSPLFAFISVIVITVLVIITDYLEIKSTNFRKLLDGNPIILISNGKLLDYNLRKAKITVNTLMMQLREKDVFDLEDVEFATLESNGELAVLLKSNKKAVTTGDLNIPVPSNGLLSDVIIDGKIMCDNLKSTNYNEQWVREQLNTQNISNVEDVFYAGLNASGVLYVSPKTK